MDHVGVQVDVPQEPEAGDDGGEAPACRFYAQDVYFQQVAGLGALDVDRAGEGMNQVEVYVSQVFGLGVGGDLPVQCVPGLHDNFFAWFGLHSGRNVGVPTVVAFCWFVSATL